MKEVQNSFRNIPVGNLQKMTNTVISVKNITKQYNRGGVSEYVLSVRLLSIFAINFQQ